MRWTELSFLFYKDDPSILITLRAYNLHSDIHCYLSLRRKEIIIVIWQLLFVGHSSVIILNLMPVWAIKVYLWYILLQNVDLNKRTIVSLSSYPSDLFIFHFTESSLTLSLLVYSSRYSHLFENLMLTWLFVNTE